MLEEMKTNESMDVNEVAFGKDMDIEIASGAEFDKSSRNRIQQFDNEGTKPPSTPDSRNKKKSKLSATPTKNNKISSQAVITPVAAKNIFDVNNIDLKPFNRFIEVDPQAYTLLEYESTNNSKKYNGARKIITEVNHDYKQIMGWNP